MGGQGVVVVRIDEMRADRAGERAGEGNRGDRQKENGRSVKRSERSD